MKELNMISETKNILMRNIIHELKQCFDPEIPVNIWDLGLIYRITITDNLSIEVVMTLTSPNCPVIESLPNDVKKRIENLNGVKSVNLILTFEPPFTMDLMSDEAKLTLNLL